MPPAPPDLSSPVVMIRASLEDIPHRSLSDGFSLRPMEPGDGASWVEIWREVENPDAIPDDLFCREFGSDWQMVGKRCFLLVDSSGNPAGTISAWYDDAFHGSECWGRIHWIAVKREYQGKGLAAGMMSAAMETLRGLGHDRCYLVTHGFRIRAIKLYLSFGFKPEITESSLPIWRSVASTLEMPSLVNP